MARSGSIGLIALGLPLVCAPVGAQELHIDLDAERSVRFISETTLEAFEGLTDAIDGFVYLGEGLDVSDLEAGTEFPEGQIYFEVDLASIDTGIGLRNRHMREDYLETDDYPYATFDGRIAAVTEHPDGGLRVTSPGDFTVHGVTRIRTIDCRVHGPGSALRVECGFLVTLSDHEVEIPSVMFLKLAEEVRVELNFGLAPAGR